MSRYEYEFSGIPARFVQPQGADPNYRGGYGGMRMHGREGRAPYGSHRLTHPGDMDGWGGFGGIHEETRRPGRSGWDFGEAVGHPDIRGREMIREFNAYSPALQRTEPGRLERRDRSARDRDWTVPRDYRPEYTNRGIGDSGYSEHWARFPMRGGR